LQTKTYLKIIEQFIRANTRRAFNFKSKLKLIVVLVQRKADLVGHQVQYLNRRRQLARKRTATEELLLEDKGKALPWLAVPRIFPPASLPPPPLNHFTTGNIHRHLKTQLKFVRWLRLTAEERGDQTMLCTACSGPSRQRDWPVCP
jgi:hypothetical protein